MKIIDNHNQLLFFDTVAPQNTYRCTIKSVLPGSLRVYFELGRKGRVFRAYSAVYAGRGSYRDESDFLRSVAARSYTAAGAIEKLRAKADHRFNNVINECLGKAIQTLRDDMARAISIRQ